ncbi:hypothetical protein BJY01DRAFT_222197 [Aspergillus pseudoustus]|uniref:UbiA prenyltransferase family-domain-containing protein n=1 Tax=Aspergillus pseudoustus TaxID=1810923 RepID=A0ABR4J8K0_9EURO
MALRVALRYEYELFMGFSWRDWSASIIPSCLFALGALKDLPYLVAMCNYLLVVLWVLLYTYAFTLFTQSMSPEEDNINKPDRPIPSGKVSIDSALKRCMISWAAFFTIPAFHTHIFPEAITWALLTCFLGATEAGGHWIGKNIIGMSIGSWTLLSPSRKLMGLQEAQNSWHIIAVSLWAGLISQFQDFRDQEGDRKVGRTTLPICFGDCTARYIVAFTITPLA